MIADRLSPEVGWRRRLQCILQLSLTCLTVARAYAQLPTNNDPTNQIRFADADEALAKRDELIRFIWSNGLPSTLPTVDRGIAIPAGLAQIDTDALARVDRLAINVSQWGFQAATHLLHPQETKNSDRLVIVHQGHADDLRAGVERTANHLLRNGFTVAVMHMPLSGWNTDSDLTLDGTEVRLGSRGTDGHRQMFRRLADRIDGGTFRLFLEPVVQTVNHFLASTPSAEDVSMLGLSGGGWTTSMAAAIDPRIRLSIPVAGSAPLYVRNNDRASLGDTEQFYEPLYAEDIAADGSGGGVATWMEIYALGAFGSGRKQTMVTNESDPCCFSGDFVDSFGSMVANVVSDQLGQGTWQHVLDDTHVQHKISGHILSSVLNPALGINGEPPVGLPLASTFEGESVSMPPQDWIFDPRNRGTVRAEDGVATISGTALAAIAHRHSFDPLSGPAMKISVDITSISSDNAPGIFITDDLFSRAHQVGVFIDTTDMGLYLNADDGGGFDPRDDRVLLGRLPDYDGRQISLAFMFDVNGFSVDALAGNGASFRSGRRSWTEVPAGFSLENVGDWVHLFLQSFDLDGGTPATVVVDKVSVHALPEPGSAHLTSLFAVWLVWRRR